MKLFVSLDVPYRWAVVDRKGAVLESGSAEELGAVPKTKGVDGIIGVAPSEHLVMRTASIPSKRRSSVESAIPFALEESLSDEVEDLHFTLLEWKPGSAAVVAVVAKALLSEWINSCNSADLRLDAIIPEFLLLPLHGDDGITVATTDTDRICVRQGHYSGLLLDNYSFRIWWEQLEDKQSAIAVNDAELAKWMIASGGESVSQWDIGTSFISWLREGMPHDLDALSIMTGDYLPQHRRQGKTGLKVAAWMFGIAFAALLAANYYEYRQLRSEYRELKREIVSLFLQAFPNEKFRGRPQEQVQSLLAAMGDDAAGSSEFIRYLDGIRQVFPRHRAQVEELTYRERELLVTCTVNDFSTLDILKDELGNLPGIQVALVSSGSREKRVNGQFKLSVEG